MTTFFDHYGLPTGSGQGWDFVPAAKRTGGVATIEARLRDGVRTEALERLLQAT